MTSLPIVNLEEARPARRPRLPRWLKRPLPKPGMAYTSGVI